MDLNSKLAYKRILLKLSGEALMGDGHSGIDPKVLDRLAKDIGKLLTLGVEIGLVLGGGNLFRGTALSAAGLDRVTGDYMGMLATMMNGLAMRDALERANINTNIMSALPLIGVIEPYDRRKAIYHLEKGRVVIFTAGTGHPFFTTDSSASLRAIEIDANILLKATKVDGIFDSDPIKNPKAKLHHHLTYTEVLEKNLNVMDATAICLCRDYDMPIRVFNMEHTCVLEQIVMGQDQGTLVNKGA